MPTATLLLNTIALDPNRWTPSQRPTRRLAELLPHVARAGFYHLEVWQYHLSDLDRAGVQALKAQAASLGVSMPIVGLYPALHLTGGEAAREQARIEALLDVAAALEAWGVKCFAGQLGSSAVDAAAYARSVAFAQQLAAQAAARGLVLTAETHPDTLCDSVEACLRFLHAVEAPNLRLCFQPFDFTDTTRAVADYEALHTHVDHVHLQGRKDDQITLLEEATIDYRRVFEALAAAGFAGYCCLEFVKDGIVTDPADFDLERVLDNARRDRAFIQGAASAAGLTLTGV